MTAEIINEQGAIFDGLVQAWSRCKDKVQQQVQFSVSGGEPLVCWLIYEAMDLTD